ncbi:hypothetical protein CTEN210_09432 [Chaetoceros tenuissimus]|uniref:Protein DA1-like domain-containing protein n=1 Tax=Chaetoceros tenuissimus TaxID=426638 RepID=A0AAD3CXI7_9STRA|nr:hypothetical protein CTEN210_09432 [Chaetoceros tenuissimus]
MSGRNRKSAGNAWKDQEDALFGPLEENVCVPCKKPSKETSNNQIPINLSRQQIQSNVNKAKRIAGRTSTKLASIISKARDEVATRASNFAETSNANRNTPSSSTRNGNSSLQNGSSKRSDVYKASAKSLQSSGEERTTSSTVLPSFNTPDFSRMVENVLVSQVPMPCLHCNAIPLMFQAHPFFGPTQRICSSHDSNSITRCVSCYRFEPRDRRFQRIGTSNAKICTACARTAILDDHAAKLLYENVLSFLDSEGLDLFDGKMLNIPIHLADEISMNLQSSSIVCNANEQKRGLTIWSEQHIGLPDVRGIASSAFRRVVDGRRKGNENTNSESSTSNGDEVRRNVWAGMRQVSVNKILCLKGLPRNLMASILAHEATHAWLAFDPIRRDGVVGERTSFGQVRRIDQTVEEGLCQLVSHLYLQQLMVDDRKEKFLDRLKNDGPSDVKLNQYYKWSIENHPSEVYGGGFKKAAQAYTQTIETGGTLKDLFQYISIHRDFPPV